MIQQNQRSVVENNNNKKPVVIHSCPLVPEFLLPPFHHLTSSCQAFNTIRLSSFLNILISQNWHKCHSSHVNHHGNAYTSVQWEILSSVHHHTTLHKGRRNFTESHENIKPFHMQSYAYWTLVFFYIATFLLNCDARHLKESSF